MKKTLLTLAAVAVTAGAWAQRPTTAATQVPDSYIDVTPAYYKFYKGNTDLSKMMRGDVVLPQAFNLGSNNWVSINSNGKGENLFTAEQVANGNLMMGAWIMNQNKKPQFIEGTSLFDFGGNIGSAMVINYQNSKLNDAIKESLGLSSAPEIPIVDVTVGGNINYFFLTEFNALNDYVLLANEGLTLDDLLNQDDDSNVTPIRVHVRLILNAYNNNMDQPEATADALTFTYFQNEAGNTFGVTEPVDGSYVDLGQFANNNVWSPEGWLVRDYEFNYTGLAGAVKFQSTGINSDVYNAGATLIRAVEIYVVPADAESLPNIEGKNYSANYDSWWDSTKGSIDRPETLYVIGGNVNGQEWVLGTNEMTYADGVYTWTGEVLGSGFKINNGSWSDSNYNIGAVNGKLVAGTPFAVTSGENPGNIEFDGFDTVTNPTVTYDPKASTVTVTGQTSGVSSISTENAPVEYYNLQGVKVDNPEKGIYIIRQGNTTKKAVIR